jgi:hypothetical protein
MPGSPADLCARNVLARASSTLNSNDPAPWFPQTQEFSGRLNPVRSFFLSHRPSPTTLARPVCLAYLATFFLLTLVSGWGQDAQPDASSPATAASGTVQGVVMNREKAVYEGARVELSTNAESSPRHTTTDTEGRFVFSSVPAGPFTLTASAPGFTSAKISGNLGAGESYEAPAIVLPLAEASSEVEVTASREEIATAEVKLEEKQRVLGVIPNFYVVYDANPVPLSPRQKFSLAWRDSIDPVTFLSAGFFAGIEQAQNTFRGYGQGATGYAKRFGADYTDGFSGDMLGGALFPSLLHQDPRYYYKGRGSIASRALYAMAMALVCKGDNGHWQFDYSAVAGNLAAGGISNLYYPASDRGSFSVIATSTAIGMGEDAIGNLFQEFLVRKLTPSARKQPNP